MADMHSPTGRLEAHRGADAAGAGGSQATVADLARALGSGPPVARWHAAAGLAERGAVEALVEALSHPEEVTRSAAIEALGSAGPKARAAVPALVASLNDEGQGIRLLALIALEKIGPEAGAAVPALCAALKASAAGLRARAVHTLAHIGPAARGALPALREALNEQDLRGDVLYALHEIERPDPQPTLAETCSPG